MRAGENTDESESDPETPLENSKLIVDGSVFNKHNKRPRRNARPKFGCLFFSNPAGITPAALSVLTQGAALSLPG